MAIQLVRGALTPSSTQKARDIRQAWAAAFVGKTGWTLTDHNYVSGTVERSVLENANGFAVMIYNSTTLTDVNIRFQIGTSYDSGTKNLLNVGWSTSGTVTLTIPGNGLTGVSFNPTSITTAPTSSSLHGFVTTSAQDKYTVHIEEDYAIMSFKDGSTNNGRAVYVGKFDSLVANPALTDTYNIGLFKNIDGTNSSSDVFISALGSEGQASINRATQNAYQHVIVAAGAPANNGFADVYGSTPTLSTVSPVYVVKSSRFPYVASGSQAVTPDPALHGWLRGKLRSVLHTNPISAAYEDTIEVGGKTYAFLAGNTAGMSVNGTDGTYRPGWWVEIPTP